MFFWIAVLVGALFAWIAVQIGFYATWIMMFHVVLSVYAAISLAPLAATTIPAAADTPYGYALILLLIGGGTLLISYGICLACLSGRIRVVFPDVLDKPVAGVLGFLVGFLVSSFVTFAYVLTPLGGADSVKQQPTNSSYMCWWCDKLHSLVAARGAPNSTTVSVAKLVDIVYPPPKPETIASTDSANDTEKNAGHSEKTTTSEKSQEKPVSGAENSGLSESAKATTSKTTPVEEHADIEVQKNQHSVVTTHSTAEPPGENLKLPDTKTIETTETTEPVSSSGAEKPKRPPVESQPEQPFPTIVKKGPLSGVWRASTGAMFVIEHDEKENTLTIDLISSTALQVFTGKLTFVGESSGAKNFRGVVDAVFLIDAPKQYNLAVTVAVPDEKHLRLRFPGWPRWNNKGKYIGKDVLSDIWTRVAVPSPDDRRPASSRSSHSRIPEPELRKNGSSTVGPPPSTER